MDEDRTVGEESAEVQAEAEYQRLQEEIRNLAVADHVTYMMHSLSSLAVERMGLTGESLSRKDLGQARLAIDAFKALLEVMERSRPEDVAGQRGALSQLQLAYVAALEERGAGTGAAPPDEPTEK